MQLPPPKDVFLNLPDFCVQLFTHFTTSFTTFLASRHQQPARLLPAGREATAADDCIHKLQPDELQAQLPETASQPARETENGALPNRTTT